MAITALVLSGCSFGGDDVAADERGSDRIASKPILTIAADEVPSSVDPAQLDPLDALSVLVSDLLFDGLTAVDESGEVVPELAESWETTDAKTWRFNLVADRTFADGTAVTSKAVADSLLRTKAAEGALPSVIVASVEKVSINDSGQVVVQTDQPNWELPRLLAGPSLGIVGPDEDEGSPTTSGSYSINIDGPDQWVLTGDDDAKYSEILIQSAADGAAAVELLNRGDADVVIGKDLPDPSVDVIDSTLSSAVLYLGIRQGSAGLDTAEQRRGLLGRLDRNELPIARHQELANSFSPIGSMTEVCVDTCDEITGEGVIDASLGLDYLKNETFERIAKDVVEQLDSEVVSVEPKERVAADLKQVLAEPKQSLVLFAITGVSESPDAYVSSAFRSSGPLNILGIESNQLDKALATARSIEDDDARVKAYVEIEQLIVTNGWAVPLVQTGRTIMVRSDSGFDAAEFFGSQLRD